MHTPCKVQVRGHQRSRPGVIKEAEAAQAILRNGWEASVRHVLLINCWNDMFEVSELICFHISARDISVISVAVCHIFGHRPCA